jgi:hypothetical protein
VARPLMRVPRSVAWGRRATVSRSSKSGTVLGASAPQSLTMQAARRAVLARLSELAPVPAQPRRLPISGPPAEPPVDG